MERLRMWMIEKLIGRRSVVANVHVTQLDGIIMGTAGGWALVKNVLVRGHPIAIRVLGFHPNSLPLTSFHCLISNRFSALSLPKN